LLTFYNTKQNNCNLEKRALQSSGLYIKVGPSVGFSSSKVWRTLRGPRCVTYFGGVPRCVTRGRGCQNWWKLAWRTLWTTLIT